MTDKKSNFPFNSSRWGIGYEDDWVFHYVYGQDTEDSKAALMALINVILGKKKDPITEIEILNPVNYRQFPTDKETTLDIKARTKKGDLIDIELQNGNLDSYQNRSLMYGGKLLNSSLEKGKKYDKMKKSIVISIVTGTLFPALSDLHTVFHLWEDSCRTLLSDRLELHYVELGKVSKGVPVEVLSDVQKLAAYLKYTGDGNAKEYLKVLIDSGEEVIRLSEKRMERASEDFYARMRQIDIEMREHDIATARWIKEQEEAARKQRELELQEKSQQLQEKSQELQEKERELQRFGLLTRRLLDAGRIEDLKRCTEDAAFKEQLCRELEI